MKIRNLQRSLELLQLRKLVHYLVALVAFALEVIDVSLILTRFCYNSTDFLFVHHRVRPGVGRRFWQLSLDGSAFGFGVLNVFELIGFDFNQKLLLKWFLGC